MNQVKIYEKVHAVLRLAPQSECLVKDFARRLQSSLRQGYARVQPKDQVAQLFFSTPSHPHLTLDYVDTIEDIQLYKERIVDLKSSLSLIPIELSSLGIMRSKVTDNIIVYLKPAQDADLTGIITNVPHVTCLEIDKKDTNFLLWMTLSLDSVNDVWQKFSQDCSGSSLELDTLKVEIYGSYEGKKILLDTIK